MTRTLSQVRRVDPHLGTHLLHDASDGTFASTLPVASSTPQRARATHMTSPSQLEHTHPGYQVLQLAELLRRWQIDSSEFLRGLGLSDVELEEPGARVSGKTMQAVVRRAIELTGEPGLGFYLGLHKHSSKYGSVGLAAMNAATLREALETAVRFSPLVTTGLTLQLRDHGEQAGLSIVQHTEPSEARDVLHISLVVGLLQISKALVNLKTLGLSLELAMPEPPHFKRFASLLPPVRFDSVESQILFPAKALDLPVVTSDRATHLWLKRECEKQLSALGFETALAERVRRLILHTRGVRSLDEVASKLHVSARTLKRKLAAEGTRFSELLENERRDRAVSLLSARESIENITLRLGYSSVTNFCRAFRRWTGESPRIFARRHALQLAHSSPPKTAAE